MTQPSDDDLRGLVPGAPSTDVGAARSRLRDAMAEERRRRRSDAFLLRAAVVGVVLFTVWSIAPATPTDAELPLIGLAEATARAPAPVLGPDQAWYVRAEILERQSLAGESGGQEAVATVLVSSIEETWVETGSEVIRRTTVSNIDFPTEGDRRAYQVIAGVGGIEVGGVREEPIALAFPGVDPVWRRGPDALLTAITERVGASEDVRLQRVAVLRALADQMQFHGADLGKRRTVLLAIALIPGIEVTRTPDHVAVAYDYLVGDTAQKIQLAFDGETGELVAERVSTLPTPSVPGVDLRRTSFESGPASAE